MTKGRGGLERASLLICLTLFTSSLRCDMDGPHPVPAKGAYATVPGAFCCEFVAWQPSALQGTGGGVSWHFNFAWEILHFKLTAKGMMHVVGFMFKKKVIQALGLNRHIAATIRRKILIIQPKKTAILGPSGSPWPRLHGPSGHCMGQKQAIAQCGGHPAPRGWGPGGGGDDSAGA